MITQINKLKVSLFVLVIVMSVNKMTAQLSTPFNTTGFPTNYLGWDATVTDDLYIRHEGTEPIIFSTNNTERMRVFDGHTYIGTTTVSPTIRCSIFQDDGIYGISGANNSSITTNPNYYGLSSDINGADIQNTGIFTEALGNSADQEIGLYGYAGGNNYNLGVWASGTPSSQGSQCSYAAHFVGGDVIITGIYYTSDEMLKTDIVDFESGREKLLELNAKQYFFNQDEVIPLPTGIQYGLLAQEMQEVLPTLVEDVSTFPEPSVDQEEIDYSTVTSHQAVNYVQLIPILVSGAQEQNNNLTSNSTALSNLEEMLAALEAELSTDEPIDSDATTVEINIVQP